MENKISVGDIVEIGGQKIKGVVISIFGDSYRMLFSNAMVYNVSGILYNLIPTGKKIDIKSFLKNIDD